ncbi:tellurite resistance TerB family protein [Iodidimonas sp. SYSU 1G8]|uniref:tellurite resistance TerB family protein n=1 Tax=Iodidimonas sp. SYSU 1G8 TaxID=3133967 RepID=UPI0031FE7206
MSDPVLTPHSAMVYLMVMVAAADARMSDAEIAAMSHSVADLPVFRGYDRAKLLTAVQACADILEDREGLDTVLALVCDALPETLRDTGYAIACTVAISDGKVGQKELRLLEMIREALGIDRLAAAGIERGVAALHRSVPA